MRPAESFALALLGAANVFLAATRPKPVPTPPIAYFESKCARCHGPVASPDNSAFEHPLGADVLAQTVKQMCDGPAQAPLEGPSLQALTALVGARQRNRPFLCWTGSKGQAVGGETLAGSEVWAFVEGQPVPAAVSGTHWSVRLPEAAKPHQTVIVAKFGESTVRLDLSQASFTQ